MTTLARAHRRCRDYSHRAKRPAFAVSRRPRLEPLEARQMLSVSPGVAEAGALEPGDALWQSANAAPPLYGPQVAPVDPVASLQAAAASASGAGTLGTASGIDANATVPLPTLSIADVIVTENNTRTGGGITVTLFQDPKPLYPPPVSFHWQITDGSAKSRISSELNDYAVYNRPYEGDVTIYRQAWGKTPSVVFTIPFYVYGDTDVEPNETFSVTLSNIKNAQLENGRDTATATVTIKNDDTGQFISIGDVTATEGARGKYAIPVTLTFPPATSRPVEVGYIVTDVTAIRGEDYNLVNRPYTGTLRFDPPGTLVDATRDYTKQWITFVVKDDRLVEGPENFQVHLFDPVNALQVLPSDMDATITINDNDMLPTVSIANKTVREFASGKRKYEFTATLSHKTDHLVTVEYDVGRDGDTARKGVDLDYFFEQDPGVLTFDGTTEAKLAFWVNPDTEPEEVETFTVRLHDAQNAFLGNQWAFGTIEKNDGGSPGLPTLSILARAVSEGAGIATVEVVRKGKSGQPVTVHFRTQDDTATTADNDYVPVSGSVQIPPNSDRALISIPIIDDSKFEANEAFYFEVTAAENARLDQPLRELVGIIDDDLQPSGRPRIEDQAVSEGNEGSHFVKFPVWLPAPAKEPIVFFYMTRDGTATAGDPVLGIPGDYEAEIDQPLIFEPGESVKTIGIKVFGDTEDEGEEEFFYVDLWQASPFPIVQELSPPEIFTARVTILDDDGLDNRPPVAQKDVLERAKGIMVGHSVDIFPLINDTDPDGDALSIVRFQERTAYGGTVTVGLDPLGNPDPVVLVYTAPATWSGGGNDGFSYTISDGHGNESTGIVSVWVKVNKPPTANPNKVTIFSDLIPVEIRVIDNDTDPEGQPLSIFGFNKKSVKGGTITQSPGDPNVLIYTPPLPAKGKPFKEDSFHYSITDGWNRSEPAKVTIKLTGKAASIVADFWDNPEASTVEGAGGRADQARKLLFGRADVSGLLDGMLDLADPRRATAASGSRVNRATDFALAPIARSARH